MSSLSYRILTTLTIDGKDYTKEELLHRWQQNSFPKWQQPFFQFLQEWLDEKTYVEVQTSGSTGQPKLIKIEKAQMVNSAIMTGNFFDFKKGQKALLCLPCQYIAGKMMVVRAFVWGLDLCLVEPTLNPAINIDVPIDFAAMIPLQVSSILEDSPHQMQFFRQLIIGGGKIHSRLSQQLQSRSTQCYATYGMTETVTHVAIQPLNGTHKKAAFQVLPQITIGQDNRGCLTIDAPHLSEDRVVTNDLVEIVDNQHFIWLGRQDNVINTAGVKVFPEQIEQKIEMLLSQRFFITSLPDERFGQKVVLLIEDKTWDNSKVEDFQLKSKALLSKYECPKQLFFLPKFIETTTGKVQRNRTRQLVYDFFAT